MSHHSPAAFIRTIGSAISASLTQENKSSCESQTAPYQGRHLTTELRRSSSHWEEVWLSVDSTGTAAACCSFSLGRTLPLH